MSSNSIVRRIAWISIVPQLLIIYLLIAIFNLFVAPFRYTCDLALLFYLGAFLVLLLQVRSCTAAGILVTGFHGLDMLQFAAGQAMSSICC